MLNALILLLVVLAVLAAVGWRIYRPRGTDTDRGVRQTSPPPDRDRTWDPQERYTSDQ